MPAGFAGRINLTTPLATLLGLAGRPGEIGGIGPIDPGLARDLANAARWIRHLEAPYPGRDRAI